jgi:hypothetical protein
MRRRFFQRALIWGALFAGGMLAIGVASAWRGELAIGWRGLLTFTLVVAAGFGLLMASLFAYFDWIDRHPNAWTRLALTALPFAAMWALFSWMQHR